MWSDRALGIIRQVFPDEPLVDCRTRIADPRDDFVRRHKPADNTTVYGADRNILSVELIESDWLKQIAEHGPEKFAGREIGRAEIWQSGVGCQNRAESIPEDFSQVDAALLLAVTGVIRVSIPLGLAISLDARANNNYCFDRVGLGLQVMATENSVTTLSEIASPAWLGVDLDGSSGTLSVKFRHESGILNYQSPIGYFYRRRTPAGRVCNTPRAFLYDRTIYHPGWDLPSIESATSYGFDVQHTVELTSEVGRLLLSNRGKVGEVKEDSCAMRFVQGILAEYEFQTGNCPGLIEGCPELGLSPAECFDAARAEFAELGSCPVHQETFGAVMKFLAILTQMKRGRIPDGVVRPGGVRHSWHFKFRTSDHTWVVGTIYRTKLPGVKPMIERMATPNPNLSAIVDTRMRNVSDWSEWFGTSAIRCRVMETKH